MLLPPGVGALLIGSTEARADSRLATDFLYLDTNEVGASTMSAAVREVKRFIDFTHCGRRSNDVTSNSA